MRRKKPSFRWSAIGGLLVSVVGLLSHPEIFALLPEKVAFGVSIAGAIVQAVTKPIVRRPEERTAP